jgi:hypothetical protein
MRSPQKMDFNAFTALPREKMDNADVKILSSLCHLARSNAVALKDSHVIGRVVFHAL